MAAFCGAFPEDRAHRWVHDLAGELLHNVDPERYPLMCRWVWDAKANTGVIREIWHAENVDQVTIDVPARYGTYLMLREELAQYLAVERLLPRRPALRRSPDRAGLRRLHRRAGRHLSADRFLVPRGPDPPHATAARARRDQGAGPHPAEGARRRGVRRRGRAAARLKGERDADPREIADPPGEPQDPRQARDRRRGRLRPLEHVHRAARRHRLQRGARGRDRGAARRRAHPPLLAVRLVHQLVHGQRGQSRLQPALLDLSDPHGDGVGAPARQGHHLAVRVVQQVHLRLSARRLPRGRDEGDRALARAQGPHAEVEVDALRRGVHGAGRRRPARSRRAASSGTSSPAPGSRCCRTGWSRWRNGSRGACRSSSGS